MFRFLVVTLFVVFTNFGYTQNTSSINFVIKNLGVNVDGHFNTFSIIVDFNSDKQLENVTGIIEVNSIETGIDSRDEHLLKEDYFDATKHKYISLQSTSISKVSNTEYNVEADLTIKGKTKKITVPLTIQKMEDSYKVMASFKVNRKDFDVGGRSFVMSKTVKIEVTYFKEI